MVSQVFYRKWRPQTLAEVVGQEQVTQTLRNALAGRRVSHAYLFCGPRGTGKTSTGRILAKAINCLTTEGKGEPCNTCAMCQAVTEGRALDVIEIDAASNTGVDNIRNLRERVNYVPSQARYKVYIIDEVHMLTTPASNALLKTLEEPPPHVIFVLATTEIHKVLPTIMSRCQRFDFRRISQKDSVSRLTHICNAEGIKIKPEALKLIARSASGSLRDAENILEQLATYYGSNIKLNQIQALLGITGDARARELVKHIINNDVGAGITTINSVNTDGLDLKQFNQELVAYLRDLLLVKTGSDEAVSLTPEDLAELKELAAKASLPQILRAVKLFGQIDFGMDSYSTLPLELALVDCILPAEEEKKTAPRQTVAEPPSPAEKAAPVAAPSSPVEPVPEPIKATPPKSTAPSHPPVLPRVAAKTVVPESRATPPMPKKVPRTMPLEPPVTSAPQAPKMVKLTAPQPGSELEQMKLNWKQIIAQAPEDTRRTPAVAILRSAGVKAVAFENDTAVLAFKYLYHMEKIEETENQKVVEKVISNFLGRACRVRCIYTPEDNHLVREAQKIGAQIINVEEK